MSVIPCCFNEAAKAVPSAVPDDDADDGTEQGQDDRLGADHGADLSALHPDGPEQADLVGALEHR